MTTIVVPDCPLHGADCQEVKALIARVEQYRNEPISDPPPPYRLVYGEDLCGGMVAGLVATESPGLLATLLGGAARKQLWGTIHEIRNAGGIYSCVLIDDIGDQHALIVQALNLIPVRVDR